MNIKKRLVMKFGVPFRDGGKYYIQSSLFIVSLMFLSTSYSLISPFLLIYLILALPLGSLIYNFIIGVILLITIPYAVYFLFCILTPIQEITKEEYEQELEKINEQDKADEISKQEKKKSFFQRYKEYKKERGIK